MTLGNRQVPIYTVVEVMQGVAVGVKNFRRRPDAIRHLGRLRKLYNEQEDDVQLFETTVHFAPRSRLVSQ